jgi:hypothetical protein
MLTTENDDKPAKPLPPGCGFRVCERCNGMGFLRAGALIDPEHRFPRCGVCNGIGLIYHEPAP